MVITLPENILTITSAKTMAIVKMRGYSLYMDIRMYKMLFLYVMVQMPLLCCLFLYQINAMSQTV